MPSDRARPKSKKRVKGIVYSPEITHTETGDNLDTRAKQGDVPGAPPAPEASLFGALNAQALGAPAFQFAMGHPGVPAHGAPNFWNPGLAGAPPAAPPIPLSKPVRDTLDYAMLNQRRVFTTTMSMNQIQNILAILPSTSEPAPDPAPPKNP